MKRIFKRLEQIIFFCINVLLSASCFTFCLIMGFSGWLSLNINNADFYGENDGYFVAWMLLLTVVYLLLKLFLLPFLYMAKKIFPYMHNFLYKFINEKCFRKSVLKKAVIMDFILMLMAVVIFTLKGDYTSINIGEVFFNLGMLFLFLGGGVLTSYLLFLFYNKLLLLMKNLLKHLIFHK